ncbi:hypothetical protein [Micromonospora sp. NPDC050695]
MDAPLDSSGAERAPAALRWPDLIALVTPPPWRAPTGYSTSG